MSPRNATPEASDARSRVAALGEQVRRYAFVALAEARAASGAFQRFAVVRILKGEGPAVVRLRVDDLPADVGSLHLLLLRPLADLTGQIEPVPTASPSGLGDDFQSPEPNGLVAYTFDGQRALSQELPAGTNPEDVRLP